MHERRHLIDFCGLFFHSTPAVRQSLFGCGVTLIVFGIIMLFTSWGVTSFLCIGTGSLIIDFTTTQERFIGRLQGVLPGCSANTVPEAGAVPNTSSVRCCAPFHLRGLLISVLVFACIDFFVSIGIISGFGVINCKQRLNGSYYETVIPGCNSGKAYGMTIGFLSLIFSVAVITTASVALQRLQALQRAIKGSDLEKGLGLGPDPSCTASNAASSPDCCCDDGAASAPQATAPVAATTGVARPNAPSSSSSDGPVLMPQPQQHQAAIGMGYAQYYRPSQAIYVPTSLPAAPSDPAVQTPQQYLYPQLTSAPQALLPAASSGAGAQWYGQPSSSSSSSSSSAVTSASSAALAQLPTDPLLLQQMVLELQARLAAGGASSGGAGGAQSKVASM